jgi:Lrp/AsnC family transcriptional regulator for asnA, asnC and gidA
MPSETQIDEIDTKILDMLTADARTDLKDIAKECSLTPSAILKRIKKLKTAKVIVGTSLELKRGTLGYPTEASIGISAENSRIDEVAKKIRSMPNVLVCAKSIGRYNLFAHVVARDLPELGNVAHCIKNVSGIRAITTNIHIDKSIRGMEGEAEDTERACKVDETDLKIINELLNDVQTPFVKIAENIGISHENVRQRYERLRREAIIKNCSIVIDRSKTGYQGTAFFLVSCAKDQSKESTTIALKELRVFDYIIKVFGGAFDIFAIAPVKDLRDLGDLTDKLEKIREIENIEVAILKFTYYAYVPKPLAPYKCDCIELS